MKVADAIASHTCSTSLVGGLSRQIIREMLDLEPGCLIPLASSRIHTNPHVHLYLQPVPRASLLHVLGEREGTLIINSCLRVLPEQLMLWHQYQAGRCGIRLAAPPADSPHEIGAAVDAASSLTWRDAFLKHGWEYLGPKDPMHYQHLGEVRRDLGTLGVRAFQALYNRHGANQLKEDGVFGSFTETALLDSPAGGWE